LLARKQFEIFWNFVIKCFTVSVTLLLFGLSLYGLLLHHCPVFSGQINKINDDDDDDDIWSVVVAIST